MRARISEGFTRSLARLEGPERAAVKRAAFDFLMAPRTPGLRLHRLVHAEDRRFWSLRVNRDLRVIVFRDGGELVLCHADHHDAAYAWAAHRTGLPAAAGSEEPLALAVEAAPEAAEAPAGPARSRGPDHPPPGAEPRPALAGFSAPGERVARRRLRLLRRATGPLPAPSGRLGTGPAPPPLLHLLRFFAEADGTATLPAADPPAPLAPAPVRRRHRLAAAALRAAAAALPPAAVLLAPRAGQLPAALGSALLAAALAGALLALAAREARRREGHLAAEAQRAVAAAARPVAELAAALDRLRRGERPEPPREPPTGQAGRAWAAIGALHRFLAVGAGDIRLLAGAGPGATPPRGPGLGARPGPTVDGAERRG